jgi:molybdate transport system ATP-binding protein
MTLGVRIAHRFGAGFALDVAFEAPSQGVTALFGPSGSGKSSALAAVAGLLRPRQGAISLDGATLLDTARGIVVPAEKRRCAVVFQDARLFPHMSIATNLRYGLSRATAAQEGPGFDDVVDLLGLAPLLARRPRGLSGGERQRVALGRALLARPRLLLLDEPLASLDAPRRAEVLPFLARLARSARLPMLYVTHALDEVDALAETLVLLEAGAVRAAGSVEDLSARPDIPLLALRRDAGALLGCAVLAHQPARGLTRLGFAGGELIVPLRAEPVGATLRIRLRARDVVIAIAPPEGTSFGNAIPCVVQAIAPAGSPHEAFVQLRAGPTGLLARVTRDSVGRLGLMPGAKVFALVKVIAFDHAALG